MMPVTERDLAEAVASAKGPLRIVGGDTCDVGRPTAGDALSVTGLTGITLYEPGALTLVARAGTPLTEIDGVLAAERQRLAFEPPDMRALLGSTGEATVGGVVAANASGPRRIVAGACRDHLLGVRFVDGAGDVIKNGGRVMKNVTGYDLVKLMCGARGTLGVLSEVALKVLPVPETQTTLILQSAGPGAAVAAMAQALGSPFEVTGAAHRMDTGETLLRIEGFSHSVAYRTGRLRRLFAQSDVTLVEAEGSAALWAGVRDVAAHVGPGDVWRLSVTPGDAPGIVARLPDGAARLMDWGGGLIWAVMPAGTDLRAVLGAFAGHATLIRADTATRAAVPVFHPEPTPVAMLSAGLRARFDPRGILNPGLMG